MTLAWSGATVLEPRVLEELNEPRDPANEVTVYFTPSETNILHFMSQLELWRTMLKPIKQTDSIAILKPILAGKYTKIKEQDHRFTSRTDW
jgi:hypothetical protein